MVTIIKNYLACKHCLAELCYEDTKDNPVNLANTISSVRPARRYYHSNPKTPSE